MLEGPGVYTPGNQRMSKWGMRKNYMENKRLKHGRLVLIFETKNRENKSKRKFSNHPMSRIPN
ncbi:MAG: hypothetical protein ACREBR_01585, partial [bacterium]